MALDRSPEFFRLPQPIFFFCRLQRRIYKISLCLYSASSPHSLVPCLFEKGQSRNISMKLFQNLTCSFREEFFLRICSCSCGESSPHSPEPCVWTDKKIR